MPVALDANTSAAANPLNAAVAALIIGTIVVKPLVNKKILSANAITLDATNKAINASNIFLKFSTVGVSSANALNNGWNIERIAILKLVISCSNFL